MRRPFQSRAYNPVMRLVFLLPVFVFLVWLSGCSKKESNQQHEAPKQTASSPAPDIHSIDFRNFDYPKMSDGLEIEIHLRDGVQRNLYYDKDDPFMEKDSAANGVASLSQVLYNYDEQGDPVALVIVDVYSGGTQINDELFLYRLVDQKPKLLWSFTSGDRADEGLRNVYFESGKLVMELYHEASRDPLCCASYYSQHIYKFRTGRVVEVAKQDWLPVPKRIRREVDYLCFPCFSVFQSFVTQAQTVSLRAPASSASQH
jgi:hypothetical protein